MLRPALSAMPTSAPWPWYVRPDTAFPQPVSSPSPHTLPFPVPTQWQTACELGSQDARELDSQLAGVLRQSAALAINIDSSTADDAAAGDDGRPSDEAVEPPALLAYVLYAVTIEA